MELNDILKVAMRGGASDIHLKAGLPPAAWKDEAAQLEVFTAQVFSESDPELESL